MENYLCKLAFVILVLPLAGFLVQVFFGKRLPRQGDWVPTLAMLGSLGIACYMTILLIASPEGIEPQRWYPMAGAGWLSVGPEAAEGARPAAAGFRMDFGIEVDNLTVVMLFVVTLVSFLVHLYSWGYMHGEARYHRFFAYLGLFSFSMLGLCITSNLLFLFIFWELVGVCSYFLIGWYFEKTSAQHAALKAFVTTRLGDLGFFLAILVIGWKVGSLEFKDIFASVQAGSWERGLLTLTAVALFLGPVGKSAQFPLHVWLPDAMEGPTPVSALIHAATMVAAGVYVVGRMFPFMAGAPYFEGDFVSSDALLVVALTGAFTAIFAASIAFAQTDIKKVLAYSTVSQLGYMMLGLGVGSVAAGLFHLTTHAFFKALLFLGSGSVIHAVHSNELAQMGGLRRKLPITWATFGIGTLAIAGLPFLSGFWSKEAILGQALAYAHHNGETGRYAAWIGYLPFVLGITTAGMTAFYMFRLFFSVFHGEPRDHHAHEHAHESPWTMTVPLCILAGLSVVAGGLMLPGFDSHWFEHRVASEVLLRPEAPQAAAQLEHIEELAHEGHTTVLGLSVGMFVLGIGLSSLFFLPFGPFYRKQVLAPGTPLGALHEALKNLWYVDRLWTWIALRSIHVVQVACGAIDKHAIDGFVNFWGSACRFVTGCVGAVDYHGVDGTVRGIGEATLRGGARLRRLQTGVLQQYVYASIFLFAGVFVVSALIVLWNKT
ncbi:MAG: NADH-quinone oxidoreductase subunit L [Planctomycetes bacterium]|nr:NADH-quinone oxidoreductase subunit L [Planctomycetota bacterium]